MKEGFWEENGGMIGLDSEIGSSQGEIDNVSQLIWGGGR